VTALAHQFARLIRPFHGLLRLQYWRGLYGSPSGPSNLDSYVNRIIFGRSALWNNCDRRVDPAAMPRPPRPELWPDLWPEY
jgi:hypothetical protein